MGPIRPQERDSVHVLGSTHRRPANGCPADNLPESCQITTCLSPMALAAPAPSVPTRIIPSSATPSRRPGRGVHTEKATALAIRAALRYKRRAATHAQAQACHVSKLRIQIRPYVQASDPKPAMCPNFGPKPWHMPKRRTEILPYVQTSDRNPATRPNLGPKSCHVSKLRT